jgi:flagellar L-ring protein precursor FlgH
MRQIVRLLPLVLWIAALPARAESLFDEGTYRALGADNKASRVGDVITVQVLESSSASTSTDTSTQRKNSLNATVGVLTNGKQYGGNADVGGTFEGGGTTQRANQLLATLTVTVREVLPNGDLRVSGEQLLTVNDESHKVRLEGRVRPQDISTDNVLLSTRLAEAKIFYAGDGDLSERNRRAWWRKLLDLLGF